MCGCDILRCGLVVKLAASSLWLDLMILKVFSKLNDSVILFSLGLVLMLPESQRYLSYSEKGTKHLSGLRTSLITFF